MAVVAVEEEVVVVVVVEVWGEKGYQEKGIKGKAKCHKCQTKSEKKGHNLDLDLDLIFFFFLCFCFLIFGF